LAAAADVAAGNGPLSCELTQSNGLSQVRGHLKLKPREARFWYRFSWHASAQSMGRRGARLKT
ncbi:MAG TPA: hypothetical protein VIC71_06405, partial [Gammaproteobacteria bacterium]